MTAAKGEWPMTIQSRVGAVTLLGALLAALAGSASPRAQSAEAAAALTAIKTLKCTFSAYASGSWKNGEPQAQAKMGQLTIQIDAIDVSDGSAKFTGVGESAHIVVQQSGWSLHFLETGNTGSVNVTTVFAQETKAKKLKAVHSRHDYLQMSLPGFTSEPTVSQYYGECEVGQ